MSGFQHPGTDKCNAECGCLPFRRNILILFSIQAQKLTGRRLIFHKERELKFVYGKYLSSTSHLQALSAFHPTKTQAKLPDGKATVRMELLFSSTSWLWGWGSGHLASKLVLLPP